MNCLSRTAPSTQWSARSACAASPTIAGRYPRWRGCYARARLLLLDHVRAAWGPARAVQRALEVVTLRFEGDHLLRRPLEHVAAEGFEIERRERYKAGMVERISAHKPARR